MAVGRDELAAVASGGYIYAMGGSHLVWPVARLELCDFLGLTPSEKMEIFQVF